MFAHKSLKLKKMCFEIDIKSIFLFFYLLNYNSIKIFFAILKKWIKNHDHIIAKFYNLLLKNFKQFLHDIVFAQNQRDDSNKLFRVASYNYDDR